MVIFYTYFLSKKNKILFEILKIYKKIRKYNRNDRFLDKMKLSIVIQIYQWNGYISYTILANYLKYLLFKMLKNS